MTLEKRGHPLFYKRLEDMARIHAQKNADYASDDDPLSNLYLCEKLGITSAEKGVLVRLSDKYSRMVELIAKGKRPQVSDEKIQDTCIDVAVYAILLSIILEEKEAKK